ncbi:MAG TPA: glycine--tRNA ligase subunit beta [Planctomycetota bacterium]|nr:glycine--tRNA ligase subunit beta [Planctomycetota bacterium]
MSTKSLLIELLVEELPPKSLKKLGDAFGGVLADSLRAQGLASAGAVATTFATPRRLAVHVDEVAARAADQAVQQKLVPVKVGLDAAGKPTPVLLKKLAAVGADASAMARLVRASDGKNETLFLDTVVAGKALAEGLQQALDETLQKLPIPKVMTYQQADGWTSVKFVRPAHRLVALHGADVVPVKALGLSAGRETQGHRFEAKAPVLAVRNADSYARQLADEGAVVASFAARRAELERQLHARASAEGLVPIDDDALLDEVTGLVERPNVLLCTFEPEFLAVPQQCLILTMKQNQKYFPLLDGAGKLTNKFLVVSNIRPSDASAVIGGNERVVRPRLADAKFFFDQDRKKTLASRLPGLARVVYHNKLGTQGERVERVRTIARGIGSSLGGEALAAAADRTAQLAKADLLTDMVGEFPELQGVMGGYYARHDGEPAEVADAIEDHYKPRFAGDELPRSALGVAVALADKLETLVGLFGIGQAPTGDKDPFALRRHALGVIRMLVERELPLQLDELVALAVPAFGALITDPSQALGDFVFDRLATTLKDQGYTAQEIDAVVSLRPQRLADVHRRLAAVRAFAALPEAQALAAANKRIGNILKKSEAPVGTKVDTSLLHEEPEKMLHGALQKVAAAVEPKFASGDYESALAQCAALRAPVDAFFDTVMVNAEDMALRQNRLALLAQLHALMNRVADLSRLAA